MFLYSTAYRPKKEEQERPALPLLDTLEGSEISGEVSRMWQCLKLPYSGNSRGWGSQQKISWCMCVYKHRKKCDRNLKNKFMQNKKGGQQEMAITLERTL